MSKLRTVTKYIFVIVTVIAILLMVVSVIAGISIFRQRPERKTASVWSQGGGMGMAVVALDGRFRKAAIAVPALTAHLCHKIDGRMAGWPRLIEAQLPENVAEAERNAPYFDGVNFAAQITCPIRFTVGYVDTVAPPHAGYAAFNACPSKDKAIWGSIGFWHKTSSIESGRLSRWLKE